MNNFEEYAVLDAQIKLLTEQKDKIKAGIIEDMLDKGEKKSETAVGSFTISQLKTWTYTPRVAKLEEEYKAQKATEEENGDATFVEKPSLRFTAIRL